LASPADADRCDLRRLLLVLSLVIAPAGATVPWIYGVGFATACLTRVFNPAKNVLLTAVVAPPGGVC